MLEEISGCSTLYDIGSLLSSSKSSGGGATNLSNSSGEPSGSMASPSTPQVYPNPSESGKVLQLSLPVHGYAAVSYSWSQAGVSGVYNSGKLTLDGTGQGWLTTPGIAGVYTLQVRVVGSGELYTFRVIVQ